MRNDDKKLREAQQLTGHSISGITIYFNLVEWGVGREDASKIVRLLEWLGLQNSFKDGIPWWLPRIRLDVTMAVGIGYVAWYYISL